MLWANVLWFFSGYGDLEPDVAARLPTACFDSVMLEFETFFVVDKFISIFSFLFGIGFALQMQRATARGTGVQPLYVRRMLWLFLFGVTHAFLLWYGDILHLYAVLGLLLIGWVSRSDRTLVGWGLVFAVLSPAAVRALLWGLPIATGGSVDPASGFEARLEAASTLHAAFAHGSYVEVVRANAADVWAWLTTDDAPTKGMASFGKFLLGLWVGRTGILVRASSSHGTTRQGNSAVALARRGLAWGFALGLTCQGILLADGLLPVLAGESWSARVGRTLLWNIGVLGLAASYVCGIVLLFRRPAWRQRLYLFAPVGRMALTNYLGQSLICVFLFYGLGLGWYGSVGPTAALAVTPGVFVAQAIASAWWLRRFGFGPAEWAWRSLTYGRRQPFRSPAAA